MIHKVFTLPQDFTIVALTATATAEVQQDIMEKLNIGKYDEIKTSTKRRNLIFKVNPTYQRQNLLSTMSLAMMDKLGLFIVLRKQVEELNEALENEKVKVQFITQV